MAEEEGTKKPKKIKLSSWLGILLFAIVILVVWNFVLSIMLSNAYEEIKELDQSALLAVQVLDGKITSIETKAKGNITLEDLDPEIYSWDCSQWYGECNELTFDNKTGYYIIKGYIDPTCEGMCAYYTLHKKRELRRVDAQELFGLYCGNGVCDTKLGEDDKNCPSDCEVKETLLI